MTQSDIKFLTFNDGVAFVFDTDENDTIIANTARKYRFGNEKVGVTRYYGAKQSDIELSKVIHIHCDEKIQPDMALVIDCTRYKIEQVQHDRCKNPPCTILSLSQRGLYKEKANDF